MRTPPILISLLLVLVCAAPAQAGSEFKKTLVIRGRTLDADGSPLGKTRVVAEGARRASTSSDGQGEFALVVPLGTTSDLRSGPLRIAVVAERRGWHFTVAGGHATLAVEIELEVGGDGMGRCIARSNDERLAASAAKVIALDGEAAGSVEVDFRGSRGPGPKGDQALPRLDHVAKTTLWIEDEGGAGARPAEPAEEDSRPVRKKRTQSPSEIERTLAEIRARATRDSLAAVAREAARVAKAQRRAGRGNDQASRRDAPARSTEPRSAARTASPPAAPAETLASSPPALPRLQGPSPNQAADDSLIAQWRDAHWRRSGSAPESAPARTPARKRSGKPAKRPEETSASRDAGTTKAPPRDESVANAPLPDDEATAVPPRREAAKPATSEPTTRPAEPVVPGPAPVEPGAGSVNPPAPSPEPAASRRPQIIPEPTLRASRSRSRPLVVRAGRNQAARVASDSCRCRIEGTIEVQSELPLKNPERVEVWLHWYPQLCDTLELFMGAPRQFVFPAAPCGPQRVRLRVLTEGVFDVVSREAMAGFRCESGSIVQRRVVLVPRRPPAPEPFLRRTGEPPPRR